MGIITSDVFAQSWTFYNTKNSKIQSNNISSIFQDSNSNMWISSDFDGISKFDGKIWTLYNTQNSGILSNNVSQIIEDKNKTLWFVTEKGLSSFINNTWRNFEIKTGFFINSITVDEKNTFWLGTTKGLYKFENGNFSKIITAKKEIDESRIISILYDNEKNLWVGTDYNFLFKLDLNGNWVHYKNLPWYILKIFQDSKNVVWVISMCNNDCIETSTYINNQMVKYDYIGAYDIIEDKKQGLWFSTRYDVYSNYGGLKTSYKDIFPLTKSLFGFQTYTVSNFYADSQNRIWFNLSGGGIAVLNQSCNKEIKIKNQPQNLNLFEGENGEFNFALEQPSDSEFKFQWQSYTSTNEWIDIDSISTIFTGQRTSKLAFKNASKLFNNYTFRCIVTSECSTVATEPVSLRVSTVLSNESDFLSKPNIVVKNDFIIIENPTIYEYNIINQKGQAIHSVNLNNTISIRDLNSGIYVLHLYDKNSVYYYKFFKD